MAPETKVLVWVNGVVTPLNWAVLSVLLYFGDNFNSPLLFLNQLYSTIISLFSLSFFLVSCYIPRLWVEGKPFWRKFSCSVEVAALAATILMSIIFRVGEIMIPAIFTSTIASIAVFSGLSHPTSPDHPE
ncbi:MAG: hypothetical protein VB013_11955 [Anaerolineaceae bacterium]|nr:hypothetical protein [Anaerolineaceae bacterium]